MAASIHMTPELLENSYRLMVSTLPFRRWSLPHPDKICFRILVTKERYAHWREYKNSPYAGEIAVSTKVKTIDLLNRCMAHELVHVRQSIIRHRDNHGIHFKRLAGLVCRHHGFDPEDF